MGLLRYLLLLLLATSATVPAAADNLNVVPGLAPVKVPDGSAECTYSMIEGTVENWGYYRVFAAFPNGWNVSSMDSAAYSATSYLLRHESPDLMMAYGKWGRDSFLDSGTVFLNEHPVTTPSDTISDDEGSRFGWWLRPNEGTRFTVTMNITGEGVVDPTYLEKEDPHILVTRWNQDFYCVIRDPGYVKFPWVVKNATLVSSSPSPFAYSEDSSRRVYYYEFFEKDPAIPGGGRWFEFRNSLTEALAPDPLAPLKLEYYPIDADTVPTFPYLMVARTGSLHYRYEWERYGPLKSQVSGLFYPPEIPSYEQFMPEWFEWFPQGYQTETRQPLSSE